MLFTDGSVTCIAKKYHPDALKGEQKANEESGKALASEADLE